MCIRTSARFAMACLAIGIVLSANGTRTSAQQPNLPQSVNSNQASTTQSGTIAPQTTDAQITPDGKAPSTQSPCDQSVMQRSVPLAGASGPINLRAYYLSNVQLLFGPYRDIVPLTLNRTQSPRINYHQVNNRQRSLPTLPNHYFDSAHPTLAFSVASTPTVLAGVDGIASPQPAPFTPKPGDFLVTTQGDAATAVITDTAKLNNPAMVSNALPGSFLPSLIPTHDEPFYGLGAHTKAFMGAVGHLAIGATGNVDENTPITAYANLATVTDSTGQDKVEFLHVWGQAYGIIFGKMDSAFSDPDVFPNTLNISGPNAEVYLQHPLVGYMRALYQDPTK